MLASTVQFSKNRQPPHPHPTRHQAEGAEALCDTKGPRQHHTPTTEPAPGGEGSESGAGGPFPQDPTACPARRYPAFTVPTPPQAEAGRVVLAEARHLLIE